MSRRRLLLLGLFLILAGGQLVPQISPGDFTFILFPDTQNEAQFYPQVLQSEAQWVVNNKSALNIQAVLGLGDIVNDGASSAQQQNADSAVRLLDNAAIPYFLAIGNHDYDGANAGASTRTATGFNQWFGPSRYAGKSYYQGQYPAGSNENFYGTLSIDGKNMLILVLEYAPRTSTLNWAASVVRANPDKEVVVVTHSNMFWDDTRVDRCDTHDMSQDNDGEETWNAFTKMYPNIIMVVSGHITDGQAGHRADLGVNGNLVNQMLSNYQVLANGGDGWLRILTFHPSSNSISIKTYSPYLNAYKTDWKNQFTLSYHNPGFHTGAGKISGLVRSAGCQRLSGLTVSTVGSSAVTGANGSYTLTLPAGQTYTVNVSGTGWAKQSWTAKVDDGYSNNLNFYLAAAPPTSCKPGTANPSIMICSPANMSIITSPAHIVASVNDSGNLQFMELYADGIKKYQVAANAMDTTLPLTPGNHRLTVQAYDGSYFKQSVTVAVH